jgi:hypothetical protein
MTQHTSILPLFHYAECRVLCIIMLNVIMLNVIILNVIMLNVIILNVIMLNVVMLSVEAPQNKLAPDKFFRPSLIFARMAGACPHHTPGLAPCHANKY